MEDFVPFEIAKKLKEKGFREKCYAYWSGSDNYHTIHYNFIQNPAPSRKLTTKDFYKCENWYCERNNYDAPTISQVLKWLREEKKIHIRLSVYFIGWCYDITMTEGKYNRLHGTECEYYSYKEAALAGIEYVLDNLR